MTKKAIPVLAALCGAALLHCAPPPVAGWDFKQMQNGSVAPRFGNIPAKIVNSANVKPVPGRTGKALCFQGAAKERETVGGAVVRSLPFDFSAPFTLEAVFKLDPNAGYRDVKEVAGCCDGERGPGFRITIYYDMIQLRTGDGKTVTALSTNASKIAAKTDDWQLLTVTCDGKQAAIYLNGVEVARQDFTVRPCVGKTLSIGSFRGGYAYALQGALDELKLYDYAKKPLEVAETYLETFGE